MFLYPFLGRMNAELERDLAPEEVKDLEAEAMKEDAIGIRKVKLYLKY